MSIHTISKQIPSKIHENPAFTKYQTRPRFHGEDLILDAQYQSQINLHNAIAEMRNFCPWHPTYFYRSESNV